VQLTSLTGSRHRERHGVLVRWYRWAVVRFTESTMGSVHCFPTIAPDLIGLLEASSFRQRSHQASSELSLECANSRISCHSRQCAFTCRTSMIKLEWIRTARRWSGQSSTSLAGKSATCRNGRMDLPEPANPSCQKWQMKTTVLALWKGGTVR
jgi:hypothetical protein